MDDIDFSAIMVGNDESPVIAAPLPELPSPVQAKNDAQKAISEDETDDKRPAMITRLKLLLDTFPTKLKDIRPKKPLDKLTDDQLAELSKNIDYTLGAKTNVDAMAKTFPLVLKVVEELAAQFTPLKIQGTHAVCFEPDVQDMIKYTIIDSGFAGRN